MGDRAAVGDSTAVMWVCEIVDDIVEMVAGGRDRGRETGEESER